MKKFLVVFSAIIFISSSVFAQEDVEGCKDHYLFTKYPNYYISYCTENYNELEVKMKDGSSETKEGNLTKITYSFNYDSGINNPSPLQVMKNYENAVAKIGGETIYKNTNYDEERVITFHIKKEGKEYWIRLGNFGGTIDNCENYELDILEIEVMEQVIQANEMLDALNKDGFIALYINFETGKSEIKPESQPIVDQIVTLLNQNENLKISIEGHTDNVGSESSNQQLSENRAKSVTDDLIQKGIDKSRLTSKGWGATKAIADNRTEVGRAKNRRVEIVKI
ncbi:MAG: OmpA family protein [Ignavibacteriae bacterium]|nr:OmpA family protein [Ignavibacteriota bacterium]MCB9209524.1 OmpA family protein [Ignavibacteriales bacterium]MCB9258167.1 OmpA family protein [Ignavibacteriales bacterium]